MDWSKCPVIESDPEKHSDDWCFKDTRLPVYIVIEAMSRGYTIDDMFDTYAVNPEQLKAFLRFVAESLEEAAIRPSTVPSILQSSELTHPTDPDLFVMGNLSPMQTGLPYMVWFSRQF
jgi:uncharacterized protein (DUF433 family)